MSKEFSELENALALDDGSSDIQIDLNTLDRDLVLTYITVSSLEKITVGDIVSANLTGEPLIEEGHIVDPAKRIYRLELDESEVWTLVLTAQSLREKPPEEDTSEKISLSIDSYKSLLKVTICYLEKIYYYLDISNSIHKEAVQDAVDIVQTKRLDFIETKSEEIDVSGILLTLFIVLSFELGIAGFIFSKIASSMASSGLFKTISNALFIFLGKRDRKAIKETLQALTKRVADNEALVKNIDEQLTNDFLVSSARSELKRRRKNIVEFFLNKSVEDVKNVDLNKIALDIGKRSYDGILNSFKETAINKFNASPRGVAKDASLVIVQNKDKTLQSPVTNTANPLPIDIYFKSCIQNFREDEVLIVGELLNLTKDLLSEAELNINFDDERIKLHNEVLNQVPIKGLIASVQEFQTYFNEDFDYTTAKNTQTIEYEFMIWSLILANKIKTRPIITEDPTGTVASQLESIIPGSSTVQIIKISDDLSGYLSKRFNIDEKSLANRLTGSLSQINKLKDSINSKLEENEKIKYSIDIINTSKSTPS